MLETIDNQRTGTGPASPRGRDQPVSPAAPIPKTSTSTPARTRLHTGVWAAYGVLGVAVVAYAISVIVRSPTQRWTWLDGWVMCAIEVVAAGLCLLRATQEHPGRYAYLAMGLGLLAWAAGDICLTVESLGGATPSSPSIADAFYLSFYPLAYVAIVLLFRSTMGRLSKPNWLDGAVVGLGAASICSAFLFHSLLADLGDSTAAVATNLAYPIGDLLLLSLVVGGTVLLSGRVTLPWFLLSVGVLLNVVGDSFNLFQSTDYASRIGSDFNTIAWPMAIVLISLSVWLRPRYADPLRVHQSAGFVLPSIAAVGALVLVVLGTTRLVPPVAVALATATLLTVGIRLALSARDLRRLTEERHHQSMTDELTGLGNRRRLSEALDRYFAEVAADPDRGRTLAFLFMDLNHFKEINDSFGHATGDELLRQLGPRLRHAVPEGGLVVRVGGDEFAVVLVDDAASDVDLSARRIVAALREPFVIQRTSATIGASIGIAMAPSDAGDAASLTRCADVAMYRAKLEGLPLATYDPLLDGGEDQLSMADELRGAVERGEFILHYQPQLDIRSGRIEGVEALIRWRHPRLGLVPPLKFVPLAEEAGLMSQLTEWVLREAIAQCAAWRDAGKIVSVSVNVTTSNLLEVGFAERVEALLAELGLTPAALVLEITETSIITDFAQSKAVIETLHARGFVVSIDDFGAGFTSLAYLSSLAVGELKLDRSFLVGFGSETSARDLELVRSTIQLGHDMGLRVVAEGIEDDAMLQLLAELGCDLAQGYFISMPKPADQLSLAAVSAVTARPGLELMAWNGSPVQPHVTASARPHLAQDARRHAP